MSADISVIILTFNEEANLPAALDSVKNWAREVFVVDSFSTDQTVDIALSRAKEGVSVFQHTFEDYSKQWSWAIHNLPVHSGWTLKLDADERATPEFKTEAQTLIRSAGMDLEGVYFRRLIIFMGKPLRWGGMTDNFDLRMWRTGKAWFENRSVNEHVFVSGLCTKLRSVVLHQNSKSLSDWLDKHNRYSSFEALHISRGDIAGEVAPKLFGNPTERRMWFKRLYVSLPMKPLLYFIYRYVVRLGFIDGGAGFEYALLHSMFLYWIDLKVLEYRATSTM